MPTYPTPSPISATIQLAHGDIRIEASDRLDTVVTVEPTNPAHEPDVEAAAQTRVQFEDGTLRVIGAKGRGIAMIRKPGSVQAVIRLPRGSHLTAATGLGRVRAVGSLGDCHIRSGAGEVQLDDVRSVDMVTGIGLLAAAAIQGDATAVTGSGAVRLSEVGGSLHIKNSNGETWVGRVDGDARIKASNGTITVERSDGDIKATTANGDVRVHSTSRGEVDLRTALGRVEVGILEGRTAHLDLHTSFGSVVNELGATNGPRDGEPTIDITARTSAGDIVIFRAAAAVL